jgi:hypothetical protein
MWSRAIARVHCRLAGRSGFAHVKDKLEDRLHALICPGKLPIKQAQHEIAVDWVVSALAIRVVLCSLIATINLILSSTET